MELHHDSKREQAFHLAKILIVPLVFSGAFFLAAYMLVTSEYDIWLIDRMSVFALVLYGSYAIEDIVNYFGVKISISRRTLEIQNSFRLNFSAKYQANKNFVIEYSNLGWIKFPKNGARRILIRHISKISLDKILKSLRNTDFVVKEVKENVNLTKKCIVGFVAFLGIEYGLLYYYIGESSEFIVPALIALGLTSLVLTLNQSFTFLRR